MRPGAASTEQQVAAAECLAAYDEGLFQDAQRHLAAPVWRAADACRSRRSRMKDMCVMVDSVPVDGTASAL